ncbi:hypothetical protein F4803DRAFT_543464 [Xylaria telfairii]|nr:hypothetical protein F4803DRAFT_543464 [Xylaria telfairii]
MVDFCSYINPTHDKETSSTIKDRTDALPRRLPRNTINHTDYAPLCGLPIGPPIETKPPAQDWKIATLQMGTWQSVQLQAIPALERSIVPASISASSPLAITYFPSITVHGHYWYFAATAIRANGGKAFLSKITIGSTETLLGVYKISAAL